MDLQKLMAAFSSGMRDTRSNYHLTLGDAIEQVSKLDGAAVVRFDVGGHPCGEHSYRGYYSDLALATQTEPTTATELLAMLKRALGATYEGYKGGDFVMGADTPLWNASYGDCGRAIIALAEGGVLVTKETD